MSPGCGNYLNYRIACLSIRLDCCLITPQQEGAYTLKRLEIIEETAAVVEYKSLNDIECQTVRDRPRTWLRKG
jgi:hypothetical protein